MGRPSRCRPRCGGGRRCSPGPRGGGRLGWVSRDRDDKKGRTSVEAAGDGGGGDLDGVEGGHEGQNRTLCLVVADGVDADDVDGGGCGEEDGGGDGLKEIEFLALGLGPLCVEEGDGDDDELCGHPEAEEVEEGLEDGPARHAEETPCARGQDERVPGGDGERADKEVLVRAQVRRQVELVGEIEGGHDAVSQSSLGSYIRRVPISPLLLSPWTPPRPSPATSTSSLSSQPSSSSSSSLPPSSSAHSSSAAGTTSASTPPLPQASSSHRAPRAPAAAASATVPPSAAHGSPPAAPPGPPPP